MIVCEEFKNSYNEMNPSFEVVEKTPVEERTALYEKHKPEIPAFQIDEASMGDPWNDFGKWFVQRYYDGPSMLESILTVQRGMPQEQSREMLSFKSGEFSQTDLEGIKIALKQKKSYDFDHKKLIEYLEKCIGKHISTENW